MAERTWQEVCREITNEHNSEKLLSLIEELNRKLDQNARRLRTERYSPESLSAGAR